MRYLSLFSGIGGFELGIHAVFPDAECLGYAEVDKNALQVYATHYPKHPALGDVTKIDFRPFKGRVDLVVAGFPCKDLSRARCAHSSERKGLEGSQSGLFYHVVRCLEECEPKQFILENVASMNKAEKQKINDILGVDAVMLNSAWFSAQTRKRLFWIKGFELGSDKEQAAKDVLKSVSWPVKLRLPDCLRASNTCSDLVHTDTTIKYLFQPLTVRGHKTIKPRIEAFPYFTVSSQEKSKTIGSYMTTTHRNLLIDERIQDKPIFRKFAPEELEMLQTFPAAWTVGVSTTQRIKLLGNAVTPTVIVYIMQAQNRKCSLRQLLQSVRLSTA